MLRSIVILLLLACLSLLAFVSCEQTKYTGEELLLEIDSLEHKFAWLDHRMSQEYWDLYTTSEADSFEFYQDLYSFVISDERLLGRLQQGRQLLKDDVNRRRWELIYAKVLLGRVESDQEVCDLRDSLSMIDITYRAELDGEQKSNAFLYKTYRTSRDRALRERAYRAYCSIGDEMGDGLSRLFRIRNQRAKNAGYTNYLTMKFKLRELNPDRYLALLKRLDELSQAPYREILEKVKGNLGGADPEIWDLGHSYADLKTEVDRHFPADSQMVYLKRSLKTIGFNLDKLPIYFDLDSREGKSQFAYAFTIKAPWDMRVLANLSDGIGSTRTLLHEIGHVLHSAYINQEEASFGNAATIDGCWAEGMAQTMALLLDDPAWLAKYAHMPQGLIERYLAARNEGEIIYLRSRLVRLTFEYEAYRNPNRDLGKLYWDLMERYMFLPRHDDINPWAAVIHFTTHPVYLQNYLYGDIVAAQTGNFLQDNYDGMVDRQSTNSFLVQNYFRFGSRYDWRELLKRGTDQELDPDHLIKRLGI